MTKKDDDLAHVDTMGDATDSRTAPSVPANSHCLTPNTTSVPGTAITCRWRFGLKGHDRWCLPCKTAHDSPTSDAVGQPDDSRPGTPSAYDSSALSSLPLSTPPEKTEPAEPCSDFSAPASSSPADITVEHCAQAFAGIADVVTEMRAYATRPTVTTTADIARRKVGDWADQLALLIGPKD